jgi:DNA-binding beta-propeller fold protein YncE
MAGPPTAAAGGISGPSGTVPPGSGNAPGAAGVGGPPTEAAQAIGSSGPKPGSTKGGLTEPPPPSNPYGLSPAYGPPAPRPPWYRSKALVALAAVVAVAAIGGGGYVLFGNKGGGGSNGNNGGGGGGGTPSVSASPAALPGCVQQPVNGKSTPIINDTKLISNPVPNASSHPFAVATTPDGKYTFVTLGGALGVLKNGNDLMPTLVHTIVMPGANKGFTFSKDGQDLLVATDGGANAYSVSAAEQGRAQLLGKLLTTGGRGAVQDTFSPDGKFLFVTLQSSTGVAVFNYQQAKASGFADNGYIGNVPTGKEPVGIELSPDGKLMYVTSMHKTDPKIEQVGGIGFVSVIDTQKAETDPAHAVKEKVTAGCNPVRVIISPDGKTAWVTVRESDALLGFDTAKMLSDPKHALVARVDICSNPIGETFAADHTRVVAACSDLDQNIEGKQGLAIVNTKAALEGQNRTAYTGMVLTGGLPRQFTVRGDALMVTNYGAGQLLAIDVNDLP